MPICEKCRATLICDNCKVPVGPQCSVVGSTVLPCQEKCAIWVRVRNQEGAPVSGVDVTVSGTPGKTRKNGFATYDDVPPKEHTVTVKLSEDLAKIYKSAILPLTESVAKGEVKLFSFELALRAKPVVRVPKPAVAVKGFRRKILLSADAAYSGNGVFTCSGSPEKVTFYHQSVPFDQAKTFVGITEAEIELEIEAKDSSAVDGLVFTWKIDDQEEPATAKMTAVKAELAVYKKGGTALSTSEKSGVGRTVHKQKGVRDWTRAKAEIVVTPAEYKGNVTLSLTKDTVSLFDEEKAGAKVDLKDKIPVGTGRKPEFYIEGFDVSSGKADTALQLTIDDLSDVVDACNLTVVETTLQICGPRLTSDVEPAVMPEDRKLLVGRTLLKHRTEFTGQRAKLVVTKSPLDAPCRLIVRAETGQDKVTLYPDTFEKTTVQNLVVTGMETVHNETRSGPAAAITFPQTIAVDAVKDVAQGLVYWLDAAAVSAERGVKLVVDAEDVDEECDAVALTVATLKLHIEIRRTDKATLDGDIDYKVTAPGSDVAILSGKIGQAQKKISLDVEAGYYAIALTPKDVLEKKMRLQRAEPDNSETSLGVFADTPVKFELLPPYEKVQCIGYFMRSGAYLGVDGAVAGGLAPQARRDAQRLEALKDIDGRCEIMLDAVQKAYNAPDVSNADPKVLKIFMAPEFYFRGKQGAYPLETMPEILTPPTAPPKAHISALKAELDDAKYNDWLFVLGSAIGAIELDDDPAKLLTPEGDIVSVENSVKLQVWLENVSPGSAVVAGWGLYLLDSDPWRTIDSAVNLETRTNHSRFELKVPGDPQMGEDDATAVGEHGAGLVTFAEKQAKFEVDCPLGAPVVGFKIEQGSQKGKIVDVAPIAGTRYEIAVGLACGAKIAVGAATIVNGTINQAADVQTLLGCAVFVDHAATSIAAHAAAGWRFWTGTAGPWDIGENAGTVLEDAIPQGATQSLFTFDTIPTWNLGDVLAIGDLFPVTQVVTEKLVTISVQFGAPQVIAKGDFLEIGADAKGLVETVTDLTGNKYKIEIWLPLENAHGLASGGKVKFSKPGSAEIINVALVRKGGKATPVRADGGAQKELLVYKETLSSVDFEGMDYYRPSFGKTDRQVIKLYGDPARKAKATVGAEGKFSASANKPGALTTGGKRITETNRSGLGGGSIFTMDGITFGLEVCLDHLCKKLVNYFKNSAQPGEPKIMVQLIPSCGMSIKPPSRCTVPDGIIFNVDAYEYGCEKSGGGAKATRKSEVPLTPPTAATYFDTTDTAKSGFIEVYEEIDRPTADIV